MRELTERQEQLARRMASPSVGHSMVWGFGASVGTLLLQLLTGVLTARLLGRVGRGQIEAVMSWVNLASIVFAFGFGSGLAYLQARRDAPAATILGAALASVAVCGAIGVLVTELLIPIGFAKQSDELVSIARVMMLGIFLVMGTNLMRSQLGSNNFFLASSMNTVGQPLLYAIGAVGLWVADRYSVRGVISIQLASFGAMFLFGASQLYRVAGVASPTWSEVRSAATFGLRGYGASLSRLANARLDVVLMPAFLVAGQIGVYVVAVNVGSMMVALFQQVSRVLFTNTVKADAANRMGLIERVVRLVLYSATAIAVVLAVLGPFLITTVYGEEFRASVDPLRILLPGLVLWTCSITLSGALVGLGQPGRTSAAQLLGVVVTVVGLLTLMPRYGIRGAAVTSTLSYASVAAANFYFVRRSGDFSLRRTCSPTRFATDALELTGRLSRRLRHR